VFLGWAARNAAEPAYVSEAAQRAWREGIGMPDGDPATVEPGAGDAPSLGDPTPETGLFGLAGIAEGSDAVRSEQLDWVSASAWAEVPWDERAELEADEFEVADPDEEVDDREEEPDNAPSWSGEEATQAPKVPAAVPIRKRKRKQPVIRSRGSGEWYYADPPGHEPLVKRRYGVTPAILFGVLGLLVAALVVFLIPAIFLGGDDGRTAAVASPALDASSRPAATRVPQTTAAPSVEPSPSQEPNPDFYRVRAGDSLTSIAAKFNVKPQHLQCINLIQNRNLIVLGARYQIPPEGFSCPPGWRNETGDQ
jgi:LysM repeat protein